MMTDTGHDLARSPRIVVEPDDYVLGMWIVSGHEKDMSVEWLAIMLRRGADWELHYQFRYRHAGDDVRRVFVATYEDSEPQTEGEIVRNLNDLASGVSSQLGANFRRILVRGDTDKLLAELQGRGFDLDRQK